MTDEDDPVRFEAKARGLESWRQRPQTLGPRTALLRVLRILPGESKPSDKPPNPELFVEAAEKNLALVLEAKRPLVEEAILEGRYEQAWEVLESLGKPIHEYFDQVMVMAKEENLRQNRLALLNEIKALAKPLGDLTKLTGGP